MTPWLPDEAWIERSEVNTPVAQTVLRRLHGRPVHIVEDTRCFDTRDMASGKRRLIVQRHRGSFLQSCPAGISGSVCCSYMVVNLASNCPFDCSYCFLQEYLANNAAVKVFTNVETALAEIDAVVTAHPGRTFRIGTGEIADSLALDPLTGVSAQLVAFFAQRRNAILELKTKSDCVEELLGVDPCDRVVVSWSLNAPQIIEEEHGTATLAERLRAARQVQSAGYRLGFHFDPLVEFDGWETGYEEAIAAIASSVDVRRIAWISLGSLRLTPVLTGIMRARGQARHVLASELVPTADGKARVWRSLRQRMYRTVVSMLREIAPQVPLYLCMESPGVWHAVMNDVPTDRELGLRLAAPPPW